MASYRPAVVTLLLCAIASVFLPFAVASYDGTPIGTVIGLQLITGSRINHDLPGAAAPSDLVSPQALIWIAALMLLCSLVSSLQGWRRSNLRDTLGCSLLGIVCLFLFAMDGVFSKLAQGWTFHALTGCWIALLTSFVAVCLCLAEAWAQRGVQELPYEAYD